MWIIDIILLEVYSRSENLIHYTSYSIILNKCYKSKKEKTGIRSNWGTKNIVRDENIKCIERVSMLSLDQNLQQKLMSSLPPLENPVRYKLRVFHNLYLKIWFKYSEFCLIWSLVYRIICLLELKKKNPKPNLCC